MKALKHAERSPGKTGSGGTEWALEPMDSNMATGGATPRTAQAAADLIRAREASSEGMRLAILLGVLVLVVVGMGGYFYVAVYMPWLLVPKPTNQPVSVVATPPSPVPESPVAQPVMPVRIAPEPVVSAAVPVEPKAAPVRQSKPNPPREETQPAAGLQQHVVVPSAGGGGDGVVAAYDLLQSGQFEQARQAYEKLRVAQPGNPDVVLGLAVIAQRQNRVDEAARLYLRVLELDARNAFAQAALTSLISRADPAAAEAKLKQLITQQPAAYLHFALGNLYASQGRWSEAQGSYFDAQRLDSGSADYAFNLAVSLEHISQPRQAADYYRRALQLAQGKAVSFDPAQARSRLQHLTRQ